MNCDAILFDLDGTLIDSERAICDAASLAFSDVGLDIAPVQIADHLGAPLEEMFTILAEPLGRGDDVVAMRHFIVHYIERHDAHPDRFPPPLPDVRDTLRTLHARGVPMSVATTKPSDRARIQLEAAGLLPYLAHVQGTDAGMKPKPSPDVVMAAARALHVDVTRTWMVGDTPRDSGAAIAAGAHAIIVAYSDARAADAIGWGAHRIVRSLAELL